MVVFLIGLFSSPEPWFRRGSDTVVTLQPSFFTYSGKLDLLTVYLLGKLEFLSVTDFSIANLPRRNFIVWSLDMS